MQGTEEGLAQPKKINLEQLVLSEMGIVRF